MDATLVKRSPAEGGVDVRVHRCKWRHQEIRINEFVCETEEENTRAAKH